jgi:hypothetical protein
MLRIDTFYTSNAIEHLNGYLSRLRGEGARECARDIAAIVRAGNRRARLAGTDKDGRPMAPLRSARKGKYRGASGPPLAPFGDKSRIIANFYAEESVSAGGGFEIRAGWRNVLSDPPRGRGARGWINRKISRVTGRGRVPFLAYHFAGTPPMPKRDAAGIDPKTRAEVEARWRLWYRGTQTPAAPARQGVMSRLRRVASFLGF